MEKFQYVTTEGLKKLKEELKKLEIIDRFKISKQISEARDKGDLSENAEYAAAREAQVLIEIKISHLKKKIFNSRIINNSKIDYSKVSILSTVYVKNITNNIKQSYTIVPDNEIDIKYGKISINTPIAKGLIGKKIGDYSKIILPNGKEIKLKVIKINF